jgi:hypothetical protein
MKYKLITYSMEQNRVLLERIRMSNLIKKSPTGYETVNFIAVRTYRYIHYLS